MLIDRQTGDVTAKRKQPCAALVLSPIVFCLVLVSYTLFPTGHPLRLVIYTIPFLVALELVVRHTLSISVGWLYGLIGLIVYASMMAMRAPDLMFAFKDITFISLPILLLALDFRVHHIFLVAFIISVLVSTIILVLSSDAALFAVSLAYSSSAAETSIGLAIPLVAFTYFYNRKMLGGAVSVFTMLLSYKRIAFGGFWFLSLVFYGTGAVGLARMRKITGLFILIVLLLAGLNMSQIYATLSQWLHNSGVVLSPNALSSGRHTMELAFRAAVLDHFDVWQIMFGAGPGSSGHFFASYSQYSDAVSPHLHNDWLRIYAEYGLIGLALVGFAMCKLVLKSHLAWFAALYTGFCFLTDNVLTYSFYWFILIFCLRTEVFTHSKSKRP